MKRFVYKQSVSVDDVKRLQLFGIGSLVGDPRKKFEVIMNCSMRKKHQNKVLKKRSSTLHMQEDRQGHRGRGRIADSPNNKTVSLHIRGEDDDDVYAVEVYSTCECSTIVNWDDYETLMDYGETRNMRANLFCTCVDNMNHVVHCAQRPYEFVGTASKTLKRIVERWERENKEDEETMEKKKRVE